MTRILLARLGPARNSASLVSFTYSDFPSPTVGKRTTAQSAAITDRIQLPSLPLFHQASANSCIVRGSSVGAFFGAPIGNRIGWVSPAVRQAWMYSSPFSLG